MSGGVRGVGSHCLHPGFSLCPDVLLWPLSIVLEALYKLVNRPDLAEPVRVELADLLTQNPELFQRKAEEFTLQFGVDRPS